MTGINHIGITVSSLDGTLAWYDEMLGLEAGFRVIGVGRKPSDGRSVDVAFVDVGGTYIEFLEYRRTSGRAAGLRNSDTGSMHVCFSVGDVDALYGHLAARGVDVLGEPKQLRGFGDGQLDGVRFFYFRDQDGIQLEAFEIPDGSTISPPGRWSGR